METISNFGKVSFFKMCVKSLYENVAATCAQTYKALWVKNLADGCRVYIGYFINS